MSGPHSETLNFDASLFSYQQWLDFFFDRPVAAGSSFKAKSKVFWDEYGRYDDHQSAYPGKLLGYLERMCLAYETVLAAYSPEQIEQGLWAIFTTFRHPKYLFESGRFPVIPATLDEKTRCIEAMYFVFAAVAKRTDVEWPDNFYFMWWDELLFEHFPRPLSDDQHNPELRHIQDRMRASGYAAFDLSEASPDQLQLLDAVFRTLVKILALPNEGCQHCALHGLGHMPPYPGRAEAVGQYLQEHAHELNDDAQLWVDRCRDGIVL